MKGNNLVMSDVQKEVMVKALEELISYDCRKVGSYAENRDLTAIQCHIMRISESINLIEQLKKG